MSYNNRILLVTSSDKYGKELSERLSLEGMDVDFVKNGILALEMLKDNSYYVVVADTDAEEMSAFAILHRLNVLQYSINFLITGENPGADDILLAYDLGATDMVDRSGCIDGIILAVKNLLIPQGEGELYGRN